MKRGLLLRKVFPRVCRILSLEYFTRIRHGNDYMLYTHLSRGTHICLKRYLMYTETVGIYSMLINDLNPESGTYGNDEIEAIFSFYLYLIHTILYMHFQQ